MTYHDSQSFADVSHEVARRQFIIAERTPLAENNSKGDKLNATLADATLRIANKLISATFDTNTGVMTSLDMNGISVIADRQGFTYDNHRWIENDRFTDTIMRHGPTPQSATAPLAKTSK